MKAVLKNLIVNLINATKKMAVVLIKIKARALA
jgi:hypothetical protein